VDSACSTITPLLYLCNLFMTQQTSYFLLLVRSRQDDTFPAMAKRPVEMFPWRTDSIAGVESDLAFILIGRSTM
jgi:hypothetical protein